MEVGEPEQRKAAREFAGEEHYAGKDDALYEGDERLLKDLGAQICQRCVAPIVPFPAVPK